MSGISQPWRTLSLQLPSRSVQRTMHHPSKMLYFYLTLWGNAMHTTNLRKVGGSIMLAVPPALLDVLHLSVGASVGLAVANGRLMVEPTRPRYTLDELLAQCDSKALMSVEDQAWLDAPAVGSELL